MNKITNPKKYYSLLLSFFICSITTFAQQKQKPNIILILTDDAGYADFSFQSNRLIPTPNIDRIANEGVKFTDGYMTGAVCSPSRAGILSGVNQAEFGHIHNFIQGVKYNIPVDSFGLSIHEKLVGQYLQPLGYTTGIVGKWHEGFAKRFYPTSRGFNYFWGFLWGSSAYFTGMAKQVEENTKPVPADSIPYMTDAIGNQSLKFIEDNSQNPFFLFVSFNAPHTPMQAKPEILEKYKNQFATKGRALNAAMTWSIDENVGKILQKLQDLKLLDNTLIIFTNDNGGQVNASYADNYPLRGMKGDVYEGGIRVAMAAMWKGVIKPGMICNTPVSSLDFIPTFINAAGGKATTYPKLEGKDLIGIIHYKSKLEDRPLYWYVGDDKGAIRLGNYKMDYVPGQQPVLYDLSNDINESRDLYAENPGVAKRLNSLYIKWKDALPPATWYNIKKTTPGEREN
jgi:arylsulfatase A-like enzyme